MSPTVPQAADGMRIEPPVSVPTAPKHMPAASAAAEPPLEPPADRDSSSGFLTGPNAVSSLVVPNANSCRFVLPMMIAPASRRLVTTGASVARFDDGTRGPGRRARAGHVDQILDRDRNAVQRPAPSARTDLARVRLRASSSALCLQHGRKGIDRPAARRSALQTVRRTQLGSRTSAFETHQGRDVDDPRRRSGARHSAFLAGE